MPRTRRYIQAGRPYELILRVKEGLPFRPGPLINTILKGAMARAQRDNKITLCHYLWMGNHAHIILIPKCPQSCVNFYQEVQKKITDAFKRLLGKRRLSLWEGDPVLAQILDPEKAIDRVAYLYANPARAHLVKSIDFFSGASSWGDFIGKDTAIDIPWIRLPKIEKLKSLFISHKEETALVSLMTSNSTESHSLKTDPDALFLALGVTDDTTEAILHRLRIKENESRIDNNANEKTLYKQSDKIQIFAPHIPKRKAGERRIFVLSSHKNLRIAFIQAFREFCSVCSNCYQLLRKGILNIPWPQNAFRPYSLVT